jgi:hypothetical protein
LEGRKEIRGEREARDINGRKVIQSRKELDGITGGKVSPILDGLEKLAR